MPRKKRKLVIQKIKKEINNLSYGIGIILELI